MSDKAAVTAKVNAKGQEIREAKAKKEDKQAIMKMVDDLKALKAEYETITGEAWPTPAPPTKKKKQPGPPSQPKSREGIPAGMSKNEAKKAARKAAAAAAKKEKYGGAAGKLKTAAIAPPPSIANPAASGKSVPTLQVLWCGAPGAAPCVALLAHEFSGAKNISFAQSQGSETAIGSVFACSSPTLIFPDGQTLTGDLNIARYIARANSKQLYGTDFLQASLVDQWLEYLQNAALQGDFHGIVRTLDSHLATAKGFLVGSAVTLADMAAWCILQGNGVAPAQGLAQKWYGQCNALQPFQLVNTKLLGGSPAPAAAAKKSTGSSVGTFVELPGVTDPTKIVTRFPPEPSGYLHIGHAKACMLNNYFAHTKYQGQLLVRFDDTNPSKEKEEFEEAIQHDLATMGIKPDKIVHTSDHFELIQKHLETLLESGKAYIDNTPVEQMREERFEGIESKCRAHSVKENQRLWAAMKKGTTEGLACCARMKMDMKCPNKCLRDPALYRCNLTPHARTKTKYKVYPTYDFACPIVDTEDGVTHALRDRQYIDRDPMYEYFQQVMGLRKVHIWEFSRLNFMQCILSKRKIQWFVDEGIVTGWDDPRVPSIQGIMRRGLTIEALQEYILSQGASKNIVNHSWDKIWTINKKMIDPVVPRYTALASEGLTKLTVVDGPEEVVFKRMPKHPKNPEVGNKITRVYKDILIEGVDAAAAGPTEEVTLMGWGNVILSGKQGDVLQAKCNPDGSFKGTQKFTWLADIDDLVPVTLVTLDHLVTKDFDDSQESFKEFVNPPESTWIEEAAFADPNVRNVKQGELVQFERKGYYRCDKPYVGGAAPAVFFLIPDGREKKPAAKKAFVPQAPRPAAAKPSEKFYLTTAINYTNGPPHMGHAYEGVTADVITRYHRRYGRRVFFLTGTDEHGQKIADTAAKNGVRPIDICDKYANAFQELNKRLSIANDFYVRTTMEKHKTTAQAVWKRALDSGDIYLDHYDGYYNVREETYVTENEAKLTDYKDPVSGLPLEKKQEESYFFKMSKYHKPLLDHIKANPGFIQPAERRNEILSRLKEPLRNLSVSRKSFDWGVPIPDGNGHVMYVWFDALTNYLSGCNWPNDDGLWPADCHIIGKDILWFHTVIWPTMLMSAGLPLPKTVYGHGFVSDKTGAKMSKSLGNVIDPHEMVSKYGSDAFRFYLVSASPYGSDIPFSEAALQGTQNADLADCLGNLVNRGLALCKKYCASKVPASRTDVVFDVWKTVGNMEKFMQAYKLSDACEQAVRAAHACNKYLQDKEPWNKQCSASDRQIIVKSVLEGIYVLAHLLEPVIPCACATIFEKLNKKPVLISQLSAHFDHLEAGTQVAPSCILFQKAEAGTTEKVAPKKKAKPSKAKPAQGASDAPAAVVDVKQDAIIHSVDIRVGYMKNARKHPESEKLFVEDIDVGDGTRQICSGLYQHLKPEEMAGPCVVVCNLKNAKMAGVESQGMVLCASGEGKFELLRPPAGAQVGEQVTFGGVADCQKASANAMAKKKIIVKIIEDGGLKTTESKEASWRGHQMLTSAGVVSVPTLASSKIS